MAPVSIYEVAQCANLRHERDAQGERQEVGGGQVTVSGVESLRMRVQLYERCFRRKPDRHVPVDEVRAGLSHDTSGALCGVTEQARFRRTTATCIWGASDPRKPERGTAIGGWQRGSLTPQVLPPLSLTAALTATRAAQSAARCAVAKSLNSNDFD
jgi:hypothetical protein